MRLIYLMLFFIPLLASPQQPFALVELFTSEGCSSCPPADQLLSTIKSDAEKSHSNIITLAYHVDYWNKLGWKDPYSKHQFTIRQENYSRVLPGKEMYTPQAIVNGEFAFVGSSKTAMKENIDKALIKNPKLDLQVRIDSAINDTLYLSYKLLVHSVDYSLRFVLTEDGLKNKIGKGENAGKTLNHDSVVKYFYSVDSPETSGNFSIPVNVFSGTGQRHLVSFVQQKRTMKVLAALSLPISK
jgi:hypothetical protein